MEIVLAVEGMHCAGCAAAVRKVLSAVPSVTAVTVDLERGRVSVEAGADVDRAKLVTAVEDAGYEARVGGRAP